MLIGMSSYLSWKQPIQDDLPYQHGIQHMFSQ